MSTAAKPSSEYNELAEMEELEEGDTFTVYIIGEAHKYVIMESTFPYGYEYTRTFLNIEEADWDDDSYMEGNYTFDSLWLNYPGLYLPNTGSRGTRVITIVGIIICVVSLVLLAKRWDIIPVLKGEHKKKNPTNIARKNSNKKKK